MLQRATRRLFATITVATLLASGAASADGVPGKAGTSLRAEDRAAPNEAAEFRNLLMGKVPLGEERGQSAGEVLEMLVNGFADMPAAQRQQLIAAVRTFTPGSPAAHVIKSAIEDSLRDDKMRAAIKANPKKLVPLLVDTFATAAASAHIHYDWLDGRLSGKAGAPLKPEERAALKETIEFRSQLIRKVPRDLLAPGEHGEHGGGEQAGEGMAAGFFLEMLTHGFVDLPAPERQQLNAAVRSLSAGDPKVVRATLNGLGPGFVKLGQMLATRPDQINEKYREELGKLSDDAVQVPFSVIESTIENTLRTDEKLKTTLKAAPGKRLIDSVFTQIDEKPIGTGSIGQTHFATLKNGKRVAIKVLKPGSEERLGKNFSNIEATIGRQKGANLTAYLSLIREIKRLSADEIDLRKEAATIQAMEPGLGREGLHVPKVYGVQQQVLVEDVARGASVTKGAFPKEQGPAVADRIMATLLKQVFVYGRFHNDPHHGNIFADEKGELTLIDWGLHGTIPMKERAALAQLAVGMDRSSTKAVARTVGVLVKGVSPEVIRANVEKAQAMEEVVEENGQKVTRPASAFTRTQALLTDLMHQGADIQPGVVQAAKSLLLADGVAREVDPTWSPDRGIKTLVKDVMKDPLLVVKDRPKMPDAAKVAGFAKLGEMVTEEATHAPPPAKTRFGAFRAMRRSQKAANAANANAQSFLNSQNFLNAPNARGGLLSRIAVRPYARANRGRAPAPRAAERAGLHVTL